MRFVYHLDGKGLDFEVDAGNFAAAILLVAAGALAEFCKSDVPALTQFQAGCNQYTVNLEASLALEFEKHADSAAIVCATAEDPAAAAQNRASESLYQPRGFFDGDGLHLNCPRDAHRLLYVLDRRH